MINHVMPCQLDKLIHFLNDFVFWVFLVPNSANASILYSIDNSQQPSCAHSMQ